tara:strand:- start:8787 stop:9518 length:732 start_codon:yes stop_codon:yes gene_type:complete
VNTSLPNRYILASCDDKYFDEHGPAFIYSCADSGNDCHVHIINPTNENARLMETIKKNVKDKVLFSVSHDKNLVGADPKDDKIRCQYASSRFHLANNIFKDDPGAMSFMLTDIDCVVKKKIEWPGKPIGIFFRPEEQREFMKVAAGMVYLSGSNESRFFINCVCHIINTNPNIWFIDQLALNHVYSAWCRDHPDQDLFHVFTQQDMDWEFTEGTTIWTGKGPRKHNNPTYVAEKRRYAALYGD